MKADLHVHTYYSDGALSPAKAVALAAENGVNVLAVTDHDTMLACGEVKRLCAQKGIAAVAGMEVSAYEGDVKIHTLCYAPDEENAAFKSFLKRLRDGSLERAEDIARKLRRCGVCLSAGEAAAERADADSPVHAMHIAAAAVRKGYGDNRFAFYARYLMYGKPAFSAVCRPAPEETVAVIAAAGGVSSLAHPGRIDMGREELKKFILRMRDCGLGGIEAVYTTHTVEETAYYKELAERLSLFVTGGSDTHCFPDARRRIGSPCFCPDGALCKRLHIETF